MENICFFIAFIIDIYFLLTFKYISSYYDKLWIFTCVIGHIAIYIDKIKSNKNLLLFADNILYAAVVLGICLQSKYLLYLCLLTLIALIYLKKRFKKCLLTDKEWTQDTNTMATIILIIYILRILLLYN